jgi:hypothetical protein
MAVSALSERQRPGEMPTSAVQHRLPIDLGEMGTAVAAVRLLICVVRAATLLATGKGAYSTRCGRCGLWALTRCTPLQGRCKAIAAPLRLVAHNPLRPRCK